MWDRFWGWRVDVECMGGTPLVVNILMTDESLVTRVGGWCH